MGLHSQTTRLYENRLSSCRFRFPCPTGLSPSLACRSKSTSGSRAVDQDSLPLQTTIRPATTRADREISDLGLFPLRSPLLRESLLVSLPPLIDMLKFSGWVSLNLRPQCVFIFMRDEDLWERETLRPLSASHAQHRAGLAERDGETISRHPNRTVA